MWDRVKRFYANLAGAGDRPDFDLDAAYAFFVFCYHFKDWIKNDLTVEQRVRDEVEAFVSSEDSLSLAADIANGVKHLARDRKPRLNATARLDVYTAGMGGWVMSKEQEPSWEGKLVILGELFVGDCAAFAGMCMDAWAGFLRRNKLLGERGAY
jgi:hypothetical protein